MKSEETPCSIPVGIDPMTPYKTTVISRDERGFNCIVEGPGFSRHVRFNNIQYLLDRDKRMRDQERKHLYRPPGINLINVGTTELNKEEIMKETTLVTTTQDQLEDIKRVLYDIRTLLIDISMSSKNSTEYIDNDPDDTLVGNIPLRAANSLAMKNYKTFGHLCNLNIEELSSFNGIGPVSFHKIVRGMELRGLEFRED